MAEVIRPARRDVVIGRYDELREQERIVLDIDGKELGVYFLGDEVRAWANVCPHAGGPVCQGKIMPRTVQLVREDKKSGGLGFSETQRNIVCPWHGYEFDMLTGRHPADATVGLRAIPVRVVDGDVVVSI